MPLAPKANHVVSTDAANLEADWAAALAIAPEHSRIELETNLIPLRILLASNRPALAAVSSFLGTRPAALSSC